MAIKAGPKADKSFVVLPVGADAVEFAANTGHGLYSWQAPIVAKLSAFERPRVAYIQVGRKNGKSFLGAWIAIDEGARGGRVFLIADSERNLKSALFYEICTLIRRCPQLDAGIHIYKDRIEFANSGGTIELRPNNLSASQSINPTLVVFDEVHMQKTDSVWNGMILACAAYPRALVLGITTPGYDLTSVAHDLYTTVKAGTDPTLWGVIYEPADPACTLDDPVALRESNPVLIDRPDMAEIFAMEAQRLPEHDYRRFRLGQWTAGAAAWLPAGAWDALQTRRELESGERVWLGFDGSLGGDSTALVAATADGFVSVLKAWENPGRRGWRVPRHEVAEAVEDAFALYDVVELLADPPLWRQELTDWAQRWPGRVIEFPTYVRARMAPACATFHSAVMDARLSHNGDRALARHISNAIVRTSPMGDYITKPSKDSPAKIDLAVAAVIAVSRALTAAKPKEAAPMDLGWIEL